MDWQQKVTPKVAAMKPSGIRKFFDLAAQLEGVLSLSIGEPDFTAPPEVLTAMQKSLTDGKTGYTANAGMAALRREIGAYMQRQHQLTYDPDREILVTAGVSEGLMLAAMAYLQAGDEVLIPEPAFVSYPAVAEMAGACPVPVPTRAAQGFKLQAADLEKAVTARTKMLLMGYPNNPTGAVLSREEMAPIAEFVRKHDVLVVTDEIYCRLMYEQVPFTSFAALAGMRERTIVCNGFSKAWAMTGMRLGFLCAPAAGLAPLAKLHQYAVMCVNTQAQYGGLAALQEGEKAAETMRREYDRRRCVLYDGLQAMGLAVTKPQGAFYMFPDIRITGMTDTEFCERLLTEEKVAVVPGSAFGAAGAGHVRISYAASYETIVEAIGRMARFVKKYKSAR